MMTMVIPVTPMFFWAPPCSSVSPAPLALDWGETYEDDRVLADIDLSADEVGAHVCNHNPLVLLVASLGL